LIISQWYVYLYENSQIATKEAKVMSQKNLFGTVYLIEQEIDDKQRIADLDNISSMGFKAVTIWPLSNSWLANRADEFVFDDTLRVLDLCHERDLKVILQLVGQNPSQEYMPDCLMKEEMLALDDNNCFWANLNHPEVQRYIHDFFAKAIGAIKHHPAVYAWDVFNEAHLRTMDPWTTKLYQSWLEKKYKTIDNLNRKWYRRYSDFSQVNPADRNANYSVWSSLLPSVDFEKFRSENVNDICGKLVEFAREFDQEHLILIDGTSETLLWPNTTQRNSDEFETAKNCDIYGGTFYPKSWGRSLHKSWELSLYYGISAGAAKQAGKPFFISELQTHTASALTPGSEVSAEQLSSWSYAAFASGAKCLQLWRWRPFLHGYQSTGRGLTHIDGSLGDRAQEMKKIAQVLNENESLFASAKPVEPAVSIVSSYRSRLFYDVFADKPKLQGWNGSHHPQALKGWNRAFAASGIPTGVTELSYIKQKQFDSSVLVLPSLISLSDDECQAIIEFVENGGMVVADARLRTVDEWGVVPSEGIPGKHLSELFGFKEVDVAGATEFDFCDTKTAGSFLSQQLELSSDVEILATNSQGHPMVVSKKIGKGSCLYFAAFMGMTWQENLTSKQAEFFLKEVLAAAPDTPWAQKTENVMVAFHQTNEKHVVYVINMDCENETVCLKNINVPESVYDLVSKTDIVCKDEIEISLAAWQSCILMWDIKNDT